MAVYGPGFSVVQGSPHTIWCQIVTGDQLYVGQLVYNDTNEGVAPLGLAAGAGNTTNKRVPFGVVIGTNNASPVYDSTYKVETITDVAPTSNDREHHIPNQEPHGMFGRVDMVKVALIDPTTVLRGPIRERTAGGQTAIGSYAISTAGTTSSTIATNGNSPENVKPSVQSVYFVDGAAAGEYRVLDSRASTTLRWDKAVHTTTAIGDKVKTANFCRPNGRGNMQTDAESMFIANNSDCSSNYFAINVIRLDLSEDGNEFVDFQFGIDNFAILRT
jgi:hypothetical protein